MDTVMTYITHWSQFGVFVQKKLSLPLSWALPSAKQRHFGQDDIPRAEETHMQKWLLCHKVGQLWSQPSSRGLIVEPVNLQMKLKENSYFLLPIWRKPLHLPLAH